MATSATSAASAASAASATAGLIFSSDQANHNFARVLGDLRRSRLAIAHRLHSIRRDAAFVTNVAVHYPGLLLVANERCGSWYIPAGQTAASAYFKSTDGHAGQWAVSTRRLNLHLLDLPLSVSPVSPASSVSSSFILVDSTRRGKRMPDALSKTVPLWCCVVNRIVFGDETAPLYTPPGVVSPSEHSQMLACIPAQVAALRKIGVLDGDDARAAEWRRRLHDRPLRPVWVTPDMPWPAIDALTAAYNVVVCCTASHAPQVDASDADMDYTYIQGAADDTENWAHGLSPAVFWAHVDDLLATSEADLPAHIESLVAAAAARVPAETPNLHSNPHPGPSLSLAAMTPSLTPISPSLSIGCTAAVTSLPAVGSTVCDIVFVPRTTSPDSWAASTNRLEVGLGRQPKTAGRNLRYALPQICTFVSAHLARVHAEDATGHVRVLCDTGRDLSVGTALALMCVCFDAADQPILSSSTAPEAVFTKDTIRVRLGRIMTALPLANPSRATLQSVNSFLMG